MKQLKYTPDDVELTVSACGKDVVQRRRKRIEELMENARKCKSPFYELTNSRARKHFNTSESSLISRSAG